MANNPKLRKALAPNMPQQLLVNHRNEGENKPLIKVFMILPLK